MFSPQRAISLSYVKFVKIKKIDVYAININNILNAVGFNEVLAIRKGSGSWFESICEKNIFSPQEDIAS